MKVVLIGFLAGYFSGHSGLGGGLISKPAIRLWLGQPAFIAVGTPVLMNIPSAIVGSLSYSKKGYLDKDLAWRLAVSGIPGVILGAWITQLVSGALILFLTALVMLGASWRFFVTADMEERPKRQVGSVVLTSAGFGIGLFSGFMGLGGGFLLVPFLNLFMRLGIKTAFGTSLAVVSALAIPGAVIHYMLGHVDLALSALLIIGILPGALVGSRVAMTWSGPRLRVLFGIILFVLAVSLGYSEVVQLAS